METFNKGLFSFVDAVFNHLEHTSSNRNNNMSHINSNFYNVKATFQLTCLPTLRNMAASVLYAAFLYSVCCKQEPLFYFFYVAFP